MCAHGEIHFTMLGLVLQMCSNIAEGVRLSLQNRFMTQNVGIQLDVLSYTALVSPLCLAALFLPACKVCWTHPGTVEALRLSMFPIAVSCMLAVGLNLLNALVVQRVSAVGFALIGAAKTVLVILYTCILLGQQTSLCQLTGCFLIFGGVTIYFIVKGLEQSVAEPVKLSV